MCDCGIFLPRLTEPQNAYIMEILQAVGESQDLLARFFLLLLTLAWKLGRGLLRGKLGVSFYIHYIHKPRLFIW
jgi:hypothetical protein